VNRLLMFVPLIFVGCVLSLPQDPTITADLAVETARAVLELRRQVVPDAKPKPGDRCPNCDGRGYVGDGTIKTKCQPCDGTGKVR
jgi:DnaJ-class molecular chaperone